LKLLDDCGSINHFITRDDTNEINPQLELSEVVK